jgi:hypothetical protein
MRDSLDDKMPLPLPLLEFSTIESPLNGLSMIESS